MARITRIFALTRFYFVTQNFFFCHTDGTDIALRAFCSGFALASGRNYNTFFLTNDSGIPLLAAAKATW